MTQTNTTKTLFNVTKVLGILLIGGGVFVLKAGGKAMRKGLRHADETPRQIVETSTETVDEVPFMIPRAVTSTGKAALSGTRTTGAPSNSSETVERQQRETPWPVGYSNIMPLETTASFK
jgi:hypothetical protein